MRPYDLQHCEHRNGQKYGGELRISCILVATLFVTASLVGSGNAATVGHDDGTSYPSTSKRPASCSNRGCDLEGPKATGCKKSSKKKAWSYHGRHIRLELRYSRRCDAVFAWACMRVRSTYPYRIHLEMERRRKGSWHLRRDLSVRIPTTTQGKCIKDWTLLLGSRRPRFRFRAFAQSANPGSSFATKWFRGRH